MTHEPQQRDQGRRKQRGSSLIEVLIAVLILSFGLLSLGGMMSFAVQMPKLSGNRSLAISVGSDMVERMRANKTAFSAGNYNTSTTYNGALTIPTPSTCAYPNCTTATLATMDLGVIQQALRQSLPAGGYQIEQIGTASFNGRLWIIWDEPTTYGSFTTDNSDNCPSTVTSYNPQPRCVFIPFRL